MGRGRSDLAWELSLGAVSGSCLSGSRAPSYCLLPTSYFLLPTSYCLLPAACCLLPAACRLLLAAYFPLPTACCLLPTAYCPLPSPHMSARSRAQNECQTRLARTRRPPRNEAGLATQSRSA